MTPAAGERGDRRRRRGAQVQHHTGRDRLRAYGRKRDLRRSGEPSGSERRPRRRPRFVVQQHQASTLHYDFRLEAGGVLKSWAVPKGPSAKPSDKRLAMRTEDHPIDYENFEGVIPPGEYGAGKVIVWDTGVYDNQTTDSSGAAVEVEDAIERGHLSIALRGKKLRGGYSLTRMRRRGRDSWLLVKKADEFAGGDPVASRPESVRSGKTLAQVGKK